MAEQQTGLAVIRTTLQSKGVIDLFKSVLPAAVGEHAKEAAERFAKMVYTAVAMSPTLQQCSDKSIVKASSISASLNLDIDSRGLAYLVPYRNKGVMEAQFQIGYMGLIELAFRSGKVKAINAHCIFESEKGVVKISRLNGQYAVEHPFSFEKPSGAMVAVYATAQVDGFGAQTIVLRADEVERFRALSKAPGSPAWVNHFDAMAKKTAIRQLAKFLPKSILDDFSRGAALDEQESYADAQVAAQDDINATTGTNLIDAAFETNVEQTPESGGAVMDSSGEDFMKD